MKKCVCIFKNFKTGDTIHMTFYGKDGDVLAANYMSAHTQLDLVSCEIVK